MSTMMSKVEEFVKRNGMSEEVKREMLEILNESLLEISRVIMNESKVKKEKVEKESKNDNVLFLSENVVFKTRDEINCCYTDDGNGLTPICVDARDFGPVKRNRLYWMNVSLFVFLFFSPVPCHDADTGNLCV